MRRVKKISNAHIFEAMVSRMKSAKLIDELRRFFGGRIQPVMALWWNPGSPLSTMCTKRTGAQETIRKG